MGVLASCVILVVLMIIITSICGLRLEEFSDSVCTSYHNCPPQDKCSTIVNQWRLEHGLEVLDDEALINLHFFQTDIITWLGGDSLRLLQYQESMAKADKIITQHNISHEVKSIDYKPLLHMTISYLCCLDVSQLLDLEEALDNFRWDASLVNVTFSHAICNNDSIDHLSYIVVADEDSQQTLNNFVLSLEQTLESFAIPVYIPRSQMEPFHSTIGVVNNQYPIADILDEINNEIPVWNSVPIAVESLVTFLPPGIFNSTGRA